MKTEYTEQNIHNNYAATEKLTEILMCKVSIIRD
jgi:hypothetical protein